MSSLLNMCGILCALNVIISFRGQIEEFRLNSNVNSEKPKICQYSFFVLRFVTARKRSLRMFLHLSVSHSVHGGCLLQGGTCSQRVPAPEGCLLLRGCLILGGACSWVLSAPVGCLLPGWVGVETPPRWLLLQAVCILLEYILV